MAAIHALSQHYGFRVIEDASHAIGASYKGQPVGACEYSDITVFSFHPVKIITTAEGGLVTTNNELLAASMRLLRSHGITRDNDEIHGSSHGPWYYQQIALGFNYRMTDMQAALGLSQMQRLGAFIERRHEIVASYQKVLPGLPVQSQLQSADCFSAYHLFVIRLQLDQIKLSHLNVFNAMRDAGILVNLHYIPVYLQPYYQRMGFNTGYCPEAERYYSEAISLPMYAGMTDAQHETVMTVLAKILKS
jgi:dTDP-4-amino-4,6-dideoxygalactose transaminase